MALPWGFDYTATAQRPVMACHHGTDAPYGTAVTLLWQSEESPWPPACHAIHLHALTVIGYYCNAMGCRGCTAILNTHC